MAPTRTLTPAAYLRMLRALPQPSRTLGYGLPVAWLIAVAAMLTGFLLDLDPAALKWFFLPFPLIGAAYGIIVALNVRDNAVGLNNAMREQGMPTYSLPFTRVIAAVSSIMALAITGSIVLNDF